MGLLDQAKPIAIGIFVFAVLIATTGLILGTLTNSLGTTFPTAYTGNNTNESLNDSTEFVVNPALNNSNLTVVSARNFGEQFETVGTIGGVALIVVVVGGAAFLIGKREGFV